MKQFAAFVRKEFFHILRDRKTVLILLVMPIVEIILFGFAISTEVKNVRLAVYDPAPDAITRKITERFESNSYFTLSRMLDTPNSIDKLFKSNRIDMALVFENNFDNNLLHSGKAAVQLLVDGSDPNTASMITGYATNIITSFQSEMLARAEIPMQIIPEVKLLYNPQMKSAYNFVPGVMGLILMLICAMMTSISIVREKERGTMEVLLVSPVNPMYIIIAKAVPYFVISAVNLATILLLSVFLLHVPIAGSLFWLTTVSMVFIFVALALGLLISSLVNTQVAAMIISSMGLMMPVIILSGMIFPTENMPLILQWVSAIIPARWYIAAIKKLMIEGLPITYVVKELTILLGMALLLLMVSLKKFKYRLQ